MTQSYKPIGPIHEVVKKEQVDGHFLTHVLANMHPQLVVSINLALDQTKLEYIMLVDAAPRGKKMITVFTTSFHPHEDASVLIASLFHPELTLKLRMMTP